MILSRRATLALGAAVAISPSLGRAAEPGDTQPLWRVRRGGATVYLYGNGGSATPKWSAPRVEAAFAESSVFWKETPEQRPEDRPLFAAAGVDPARPLSKWLTPAERETVTAACAQAGITYASLEPLKPWLATLSLSQALGRRQLHAPIDDPIPVLSARAREQGKPIRTEFPDAASQLAMFNTMSRDAQAEFMRYTIENSRLTQDAIDRRRRAWAAGDLTLETRQVEHLKRDFPNLYEPFEAQRNRAWPARFKEMLAGGGITFVLVGADHLVGSDSVLVQLRAAGLKAERI